MARRALTYARPHGGHFEYPHHRRTDRVLLQRACISSPAWPSPIDTQFSFTLAVQTTENESVHMRLIWVYDQHRLFPQLAVLGTYHTCSTRPTSGSSPMERIRAKRRMSKPGCDDGRNRHSSSRLHFAFLSDCFSSPAALRLNGSGDTSNLQLHVKALDTDSGWLYRCSCWQSKPCISARTKGQNRRFDPGFPRELLGINQFPVITSCCKTWNGKRAYISWLSLSYIVIATFPSCALTSISLDQKQAASSYGPFPASSPS